jgi:aldose 1-epimerase
MNDKGVSRRDFLKAAGAAGAAGGLIAGLSGCTGGDKPNPQKAMGGSPMGLEKTLFGHMPDGRPVDLYTLASPSGMRAKVLSYGATLHSLEVPDRQGKLFDVALGHATVEEWLDNQGSFGASIGRYGNRIGKARFTLDGHTYALAANNGENSIHGGQEGFHKKLWTFDSACVTEEPPEVPVSVRFKYVSPDGEEGYPGTLTATAEYSLLPAGGLLIQYKATTDKPTVVNLVNHAYWNLGPSPDCLGHVMQLRADAYTVFDAGQIPTGEIRPVRGTPLDFTTPTAIGARIGEMGNGYDNNYVLRGQAGELRLIATVADPKSGRTMELSTDQPGVQFYTANGFRGFPGKNGAVYGNHAGFCLETQRFPDSPNHADFPSAVLRPGETYRHRMQIKVVNA